VSRYKFTNLTIRGDIAIHNESTELGVRVKSGVRENMYVVSCVCVCERERVCVCVCVCVCIHINPYDVYINTYVYIYVDSDTH